MKRRGGKARTTISSPRAASRIGLSWARLLGFDLLEEPELRAHYRTAHAGARRSARCPISPIRRARIRATAFSWRSRPIWKRGRSPAPGSSRPANRRVADRALRNDSAPRRPVRCLAPRRGTAGPIIAKPRRPVMVGIARRRPARAGLLGAAHAAERPARFAGPGDPSRRATGTPPRVRRRRRRPRPSRPAASHRARPRCALAARSGHRVLRRAFALLVPERESAQRADGGRRVADTRQVPGLRGGGLVGMGSRIGGAVHPDRRGGTGRDRGPGGKHAGNAGQSSFPGICTVRPES